MGAGLVLTYSGLNDPVGGPVGVVRDVLQGRTPTPGIQTITAALGADVGAGLIAGAKAIQPGGGSGASGSAGGAGVRSRVLAVARSYLGVPYSLGGASRRGIDCSGLVLVAYRDGAGIALPHRATLQAARGRRVDRSQVLPGDLVAWGVPGNYPHIALAVSTDQVIVASTWGKPVQYQTLWERKVPGFGYPDIIRILEA